MKNLEEVLEAWKEDCQVPRNNLDEASRQTPSLHAKYLEYLSFTRLRLKDAEMKQKILLKDKWLYYNGKMDHATIERLGWEFDPFGGLKVLKGEMEYYYNSDKDIQESEAKAQYLKEMIDVLKEIVDTLRWRHQTIGNMIKWRQFEAGN